MKIYVPSSWKNDFYEEFIDTLTSRGHTILDWRQFKFGYSSVDPNYKTWTRFDYENAMDTNAMFEAYSNAT